MTTSKKQASETETVDEETIAMSDHLCAVNSTAMYVREDEREHMIKWVQVAFVAGLALGVVLTRYRIRVRVEQA